MSTGKPRDSWKEREWRGWLERWQRSGLSVAGFCRRRGLDARRFYAWRRILAQRDGEQTAFVPVQVLTNPESVSVLELVLAGDRRLRVPRGFDVTTLRQVLRVLEEDGAC